MSQDTFILLTTDTISYVLKKSGLKWNVRLPVEILRKTPRVFETKFGDAVCCYRNRHEEEFTRMIHEYPDDIFVDYKSIGKYAAFALSKIVGEDCFLMDIVRIVSFFADLAIYCHSNNCKHLISSVVFSLNLIYSDSLKTAFNIVGGIHSLFRFSEQYLQYREFPVPNVMTENYSSADDIKCAMETNEDIRFELSSIFSHPTRVCNIMLSEKNTSAIKAQSFYFDSDDLEMPDSTSVSSAASTIRAIDSDSTCSTEDGNADISNVLDFSGTSDKETKYA